MARMMLVCVLSGGRPAFAVHVASQNAADLQQIHAVISIKHRAVLRFLGNVSNFRHARRKVECRFRRPTVYIFVDSTPTAVSWVFCDG